MTDIKKTLNDRAAKYGDFRYHAELSVHFKKVMHKGRSWPELYPYMQESLEMIQHKIARILNGDPKYLDSWVDIIGYAQLVVDRLKQEELAREIRAAFEEVDVQVEDLKRPDVIKPTTSDRDAW
jgi:hypothetical protein